MTSVYLPCTAGIYKARHKFWSCQTAKCGNTPGGDPLTNETARLGLYSYSTFWRTWVSVRRKTGSRTVIFLHSEELRWPLQLFYEIWLVITASWPTKLGEVVGLQIEHKQIWQDSRNYPALVSNQVGSNSSSHNSWSKHTKVKCHSKPQTPHLSNGMILSFLPPSFFLIL
jgi:hypothetical protein